jgi:hypothetical protein
MIINFVNDNPELTLDQVGEKWGMSGPGVCHMLMSAGISKPRVYPTNMKRDRDEIIAMMRRDGMQQKDIATELGMTRGAINGVLVRHYPELQTKRQS